MATTTINSGYLGAGITLAGDTILTNTSTGTITNTAAAVFGVSGGLPNTVVNAGSIAGGGGAGITLLSGGVVTNQNAGIIGGASGTTVASIGITGGAGTVTNFGRLTASGTGVRLEAGGTVANQTGGTIIAGYRGVSVGGGPDAVTNAGLISAAASGIVVYGTGGSAANQTGGTILSGADGIYVSAGTATNQGIIDATRHGIFMNAGATVNNLASGAITGAQNGVEVIGGGLVANASGATISGRYIGVDISGANATITNAGMIGATEPGIALAVRFDSGFSDRLVVIPGAVFNGTVDGGNTIGGPATSTLELALGAGVGTVSGIGTKYINFAAVTLDAGAAWAFTGANTIAAGVTLTNSGTLTNAGSLNAAGVVIDSGSLANSGSFSGSIVMSGGAIFSNASAAIFTGAIYAASGGAARTVVNAGTFSVAGDVPAINFQSAGTVSNASGGTISGIRGIDISSSASINNQGLILATGAPGTKAPASFFGRTAPWTTRGRDDQRPILWRRVRHRRGFCYQWREHSRRRRYRCRAQSWRRRHQSVRRHDQWALRWDRESQDARNGSNAVISEEREQAAESSSTAAARSRTWRAARLPARALAFC